MLLNCNVHHYLKIEGKFLINVQEAILGILYICLCSLRVFQFATGHFFCVAPNKLL
jgi:hypothetical protein